MPLIDIKALRVFLVVAEERSMVRAARCLHLSQPAVSYHITKLEEALGHKLLNRSSHGVSLTNRGIQLCELSASLLPIIENGVLLFTGEQTSPERRREVRIGLARLVYKFIYPSIMPAVSAGLPDLRIVPVQATSHRSLDILYEGAVDFAVTFETPPAVQGFADRVLSYDDYVALCAPGHPLLAPGAVSVDQLLQYPLLLVDKSLTLRRVDTHFRNRGLRPRIVPMPSTEDVLKATAQRRGFTLFSRLGYRFLSQYVPHECVSVDDVRIGRTLRLVYNQQAPSAQPVAAVLQAALEMAARKEGLPHPQRGTRPTGTDGPRAKPR